MLRAALKSAKEAGEIIETEPLPPPNIEIPKGNIQADYASTTAMSIASLVGQPAQKIANVLNSHLTEALQGEEMLERVEVAGPGFINFTIKPRWWQQQLPRIVAAAERYGASDLGKDKRVQIEYVSANPTGPLHVGHGRWAAVGNALSSLLRTAGYEVETEYYINDAGRQVKLLGLSVYSRYQQLLGHPYPDPEDGYRGSYVTHLAERMIKRVGQTYLRKPVEECLDLFTRYAVDEMLSEIKEDLSIFGIRFDSWFSEASLFEEGLVQKVLDELQQKGYLYTKDGALWLKSEAFGDDKDRVIRKEDGEYTYLASDAAYHHVKFSRGFDRLINIWGADHHGYVPRMEAVIRALGHPKERLVIRIGQLVTLVRAGQPVPMSKRAGEFVTLRDVINEVGKDAALFFFLMRRLDSPLEFDLDLAKQKSLENPVYYVHYAYARLSSVLRQAKEHGIELREPERIRLERLSLPEELRLIKKLCEYPDMIEEAARALEPHRITFYLQELSALLHHYYYQHRIISEDEELTQARLLLATAVRTVLRNASNILGVSAPERM
jgi:arginyl-tRNA synthetase